MDSVKIDLNSIYHNFQYHHPLLDPDIIVPITKNKFQPYFFDDYPKIIVILEGSRAIQGSIAISICFYRMKVT